jgi:hypothetical protein
MDVYGKHLRDIADILLRAGFASSVRGESTARFLYVEHADRAVEVYWGCEGFTVELFEQPVEVSVRGYQQDAPDIAAKQAVEWLSRQDSAA